jgi:hypothetical protein
VLLESAVDVAQALHDVGDGVDSVGTGRLELGQQVAQGVGFRAGRVQVRDQGAVSDQSGEHRGHRGRRGGRVVRLKVRGQVVQADRIVCRGDGRRDRRCTYDGDIRCSHCPVWTSLRSVRHHEPPSANRRRGVGDHGQPAE